MNGQAVPLEYKFKNADELVHRVHRHEPAITDEPLTILERTARFLVVHKPSAMPCHPTGRYRLNSMLEILKTMGHEDVYLVNRLDRLTSGVLLLPFQKKDAVDLQQKILDFDVTKEYVCRVVGEFPPYTALSLSSFLLLLPSIKCAGQLTSATSGNEQWTSHRQ